MQCTVARQLSVAIENQPGRLAAVCRLLASEGINIRDLTVVDTIEQGMIRLVPNDPALCKTLLGREGLYVIEAEVLVVILKDFPGELGRIAEGLAAAGINIDYAYGTEDSSEREMRVVLKVSNLPAARAVVEGLTV
ncbi:MAG TPA: amino acid-binding protein [Verrucomicrobiales bacterium]|nr:amino acid-binding protein [Verrucomicrobiales bacterium]